MAATALQGKTDVMGHDGFTWWVGEVEDKEDPQEIGRVRVRILDGTQVVKRKKHT